MTRWSGEDSVGFLKSLDRGNAAELDLAGAALALAALDQEQVPLARYLDHLELMATDAARAISRLDQPEDAARALARVIAETHGYEGDTKTYDDQQNANLMRVIDRRRGLPVALGILYIHTARAQGWTAAGLNFPNHFLIRLDIAGARVIMDPFHGGQILQANNLRALLSQVAGAEVPLEPEYYAPVPDQMILLRLQNNIKLRFIAEQRYDRALEVLQHMLLFADDQAMLWREAGLVHVHLGQHKAALEVLGTYIELPGVSESDREQMTSVMQRLRTRLN
jgi:regulator of sirC expression with transglutaminase-like and TPR domain